MTRRLYYTDSLTTEFSAHVVGVRTLEPSRFAVELDATCFYPTSGGQLHDIGLLAGAPVVDVVDEQDRVVHVLKTDAPPALGALVAGRIDAARRRHHRQQHTGQHVLSRVLENRLQLPTVSSRLGETDNTIDLPAPAVDAAALDAAEDAANHLLWRGLAVSVRFLQPGDVAESGLRKAPARTGTIRVIDVEGFDRSACGGTHVANTAEIGTIAITGIERARGNVRVHFLCGDRALSWRRSCDRLVAQLAVALTTGRHELAAAVERMQEEARLGTRRAQALARELLQARAREWAAQGTEIATAGGRLRLVAQELPVEFAPLAQEAAGWVVAAPRTVAALCWYEGGRSHLVLASHPAAACDCRVLLAATLAGTAGKGGGSAERARGSASSVEARELLTRAQAALAALGPHPAAG